MELVIPSSIPSQVAVTPLRKKDDFLYHDLRQKSILSGSYLPFIGNKRPVVLINSISHSLEMIGEPWTVTVRSLPETNQEETYD
jgi:hypothetical protein